ncbi:MAG: hypothetical protein COZ06_33355 [Armatimonadetes bacterium CG_4_10_14_3_um_filter_66_18]|nr:hypothetical protein [Armatimonadota bacterium]OIO96200.1 MAG: hypothetical protein AUJ96_25035 [Armatimonadetes bacterium CG2_30_66_41]PIU94415.1 MAG: hypothetical protein COS65_07880 [Armatimonadetes bacterium CG06_land_8_20_14_3_00_66_21]PIW17146.1 MAG: hypothetical protein COW34_05290 [Armatimonadetes bacterium CG17_big_fil_post_rev_8_21_14_2_50_66_6]PIX46345.1 MAG: hypothetical protein COZ57_12675 [Armatimonadetes bacterium CG_4_8_14_3_um_filter_66_20]PIY37298.1 MAG: hypothetical prote
MNHAGKAAAWALVGLFALAIASGWWVQSGGQKEGAFIRAFQAAHRATYTNIVSLRCTGDTLYIEVQPTAGAAAMEAVARDWVLRLSDARRKEFGKGEATVVIMRDLQVLLKAHTKKGVRIEVETVKKGESK